MNVPYTGIPPVRNIKVAMSAHNDKKTRVKLHPRFFTCYTNDNIATSLMLHNNRRRGG